RLLGLAVLLGGEVPGGDVTGDLGEADQLAVLPDRVDQDMGTEPAAVLAHPPALGLVTAIARGDAERTLRFAALDVLLRIEPREVLADHLGIGIALDPLAAGVPAQDGARCIEHVDRVIGNALQQQVLVTGAGVWRAGGAHSDETSISAPPPCRPRGGQGRWRMTPRRPWPHPSRCSPGTSPKSYQPPSSSLAHRARFWRSATVPP